MTLEESFKRIQMSTKEVTYNREVTYRESGWTPMETVKILDDLVYRYSQALYFGKKDLMEEIIDDTREFLARS